MLLNIIAQLFGHSPNIHDIVIAIVSFMFGIILIPQLKDVYRHGAVLNLYTSSITTIGLIVLTVNFFVMGFWISFAADFLNSVVWGLIFIFSIKNLKEKKEKISKDISSKEPF